MDELEKLSARWKAAKRDIAPGPGNPAVIIALARRKKRNSIYFQYGNIAVLLAVLLVISAFFFYIAPMQDLLSRVGIALMTFGLLLRILIEAFSVMKFLGIDISASTLKNTEDTAAYFRFRKKIHGPVTVSIVAAYTIGFYVLTPEFSGYIDLPWMILIDLSYLAGAVFLIWQIRKGIRREMDDLAELVTLKQQLSGED